MTDMQAAPVQGTAQLSTSIDQGGAPLGTGGGAPDLNEPKAPEPAKVDKPESPGDTLKGELARIREEEAKTEKGADPKEPVKEDKTDPKAEDDKAKEEKAERERAKDGKFAKTEKVEAPVEGKEGAPEKVATEQDGLERRPSEGRQHVEPPARFLPKEKELWGNVPNSVKSAIQRISQEHETEVSQYRESHENWQKLSKFDQMAKQHNTNVHEALERYTALDGLLQNNPIEAIRQIMATRGITPEQYAHHVLNNPDAHRAPATPAAPDPAVRQMSGKVEQLEATIEQMRLEKAASDIITPFRAANPRYDELQDDIALFLQSGKIPASFSPQERLEAAYDMAVRINPTSAVAADPVVEAIAAKTERPAKLDAGTKSIRGAPTGQDPEEDDPDATDVRALLRKELRRAS